MRNRTQVLNAPNQQSDERRAQTVKVSVRFGRPSMDCRNFGLCRIEQYKDGDEAPLPNCAVATIWCDLSGSLYFQFERNTMTQKTQEKYFGKSVFLIEEEVTLCCCIAKKINWKSNPVRKGRYPITSTNEHFTLKIH